MFNFSNDLKIWRKKRIVMVFFPFIFSSSFVKTDLAAKAIAPFIHRDSLNQKKWADSLIKTMTLDQKIGQLFIIDVYSNRDDTYTSRLENLIKTYKIGGLIFMKGSPKKQLRLTNHLQSKSKIPLFIAMDAEWGLSMRMDSCFQYPRHMTLGAIENDTLLYQMGQRIAIQCKIMGIHINFAPVVDININPRNPIIGNRSFGENRIKVARKSLSFVNGIQSMNVIACAKHFPGHGDTHDDSHKKLPLLNFNLKRLDSIELYPYKKLAKSDLKSVMVAHLNVPALNTENQPASLSKKTIIEILKNKIQFKGLVFTDALNMKAVSNYTTPDSIPLKAFKAGNDILLMPTDIKKGILTIKKAVKKDTLLKTQLEKSVIKILRAKYWVGLNNLNRLKPLDENNLSKKLHHPKDDVLLKNLTKNAITLLKNEDNLLPLQASDTLKIASFNLGEYQSAFFSEVLNTYKEVNSLEDVTLDNYKRRLENYNIIIIAIYGSNKNNLTSYSLSKTHVQLIKSISLHKKVILTLFSNPYLLLNINNFQSISSLIVAYENRPVFEAVTAQQIFGTLPFLGKLPISIPNQFEVGTGIIINDSNRKAYRISIKKRVKFLEQSQKT